MVFPSKAAATAAPLGGADWKDATLLPRDGGVRVPEGGLAISSEGLAEEEVRGASWACDELEAPNSETDVMRGLFLPGRSVSRLGSELMSEIAFECKTAVFSLVDPRSTDGMLAEAVAGRSLSGKAGAIPCATSTCSSSSSDPLSPEEEEEELSSATGSGTSSCSTSASRSPKVRQRGQEKPG